MPGEAHVAAATGGGGGVDTPGITRGASGRTSTGYGGGGRSGGGGGGGGGGAGRQHAGNPSVRSEARPSPHVSRGAAEERARLREGLRRQGVPIPEALREPAHDDDDGDARRAAGRPSEEEPKVRVRMWVCKCGYCNWPSRHSCRACEAPRRPGADRREEWWARRSLPEGAERDVGADHGPGNPAVAAARGRASVAGGGGTDAPGCPTVRVGPAVRPTAKAAPRPQRAGETERRLDPADDAAGSGSAAAPAARAQVREEFTGAPKPSDLPPLRGWAVPSVPRAAILRDAKAAADRASQLASAGAKPSRLRRAEAKKEAAEQQVRIAGGPNSRSLLWQIKNEEEHIEKADKAVQKELADIEGRRESIRQLTAEIEAGEELVQRHRARREEAVARLRYLSNQKWVESVPDEWIAHFKTLAQTLGETRHQAHAMVQTLVDLMVPPVASVDLSAADSESEDGDGGRGSAGASASPSSGTSRTMAESDDGGADGREGDGRNWIEQRRRHEQRLQAAEAELEQLRARRLSVVACAQARDTREGQVKRALGADGVKSEDANGDEEMVPGLSVAQAGSMHQRQMEDLVAEIAALRHALQEEVVPCSMEVDGETAPRLAAQADLQRPASAALSTTHAEGERQPLQRRGRLGRRLEQRSPADPASAAPQATFEQRWEQRWVSAERRPPRAHRACSRGRPSSLGAAVGNHGIGGTGPPHQATPSLLSSLRGLVERETIAQRSMADDLVSRVETSKQERMQQLQDCEAEQLHRTAEKHAAVLQAKADIEASHAVQGHTRDLALAPTYGPTGLRLDEQQRRMQQAGQPPASLAQGGQEGAVGGGGPRRRTRWDAMCGTGLPPPSGSRGRRPPSSSAAPGEGRAYSRSLRPGTRRRGDAFW